MTQVQLIKKKRRLLTVVVGSYIFLLIYSSLFVPVKAQIGNDEADADYGYYPVWALSEPPTQVSTDKGNADLPLTIRFNFLAWALQTLFITLVFIVLLTRIILHYRKQAQPRI